MADILIFYNTTRPPPPTILGEPVRVLRCSMDRPGFVVVGAQRSDASSLFESDDGFSLLIGRLFGGVARRELSQANLDSALGQLLLVEANTRTGQVSVSTDASATIPAFVATTQDGTLVSSRLDWLLAMADQPWRVDWQQMFAFSYASRTLQNRTLIKGVEVLPGGTDCFFRDGRLRQSTRWKPSEHYEYSREVLDAYVDALANAVGSALQGVSRPVVSLTAGFDSRLILAAALASKSNVALGAWGTWNRADRFVDNQVAEVIARSMSLPLLSVPQEDATMLLRQAPQMWRHTAGLARHSYLFMEYYREQLRGRSDCELDGTGAEVIKGVFYRGHTLNEVQDPKGIVAASLNLPATSSNPYGGEAKEIFRTLRAYVVDAHFADLPVGLGAYELLDAVQYRSRSQQRWWPRTSFITRLFPTFYPFRAARLLELAFKIPSEVKRNNAIHRYAILRLCPKLLQWPFQADYRRGIGVADFGTRVRRRLLAHFGVFQAANMARGVPETSDWRLMETEVYRHFETLFPSVRAAFPETFGAASHKSLMRSFAGPNFFRMYSCLGYLLQLRASGVAVEEE
jgi:hypothetical protein